MIRCVAVWLLVPISVSAAEPTVANLIKQLNDPDPGTRVLAAEALGRLGPLASEAAPELVKLLKPDPSVADRVAFLGMSSVGRHGIHPLAAVHFLAEFPRLKERSDDNFLVSGAAEAALRRIGPKAIPALAASWRSTVPRQFDYSTRIHLFEILQSMPPDCRDAVSLLMEVLADARPKMRMKAAEALARFGHVAEPAIPALVKLLNDRYCVQAFLFTGRRKKGNAELELPATSVKAAAARTLRRIGPKGLLAFEERGLPILLNDLGRKMDEFERRANCEALIELGPKARLALPKLRELAARPAAKRDYMMAYYPIEVIWSIGPDALPTLRELLKGNDVELQKQIIRTSPSKPDCPEWAVPMMKDVLKSDDSALRKALLDRMRSANAIPTSLVADLIPLLQLDLDQAWFPGVLFA